MTFHGCIPFFVETCISALSGVARVLRPRVAIGVCAVQHGSVPGAVSEDLRTAGAARPGREQQRSSWQ